MLCKATAMEATKAATTVRGSSNAGTSNPRQFGWACLGSHPESQWRKKCSGPLDFRRFPGEQVRNGYRGYRLPSVPRAVRDGPYPTVVFPVLAIWVLQMGGRSPGIPAHPDPLRGVAASRTGQSVIRRSPDRPAPLEPGAGPKPAVPITQDPHVSGDTLVDECMTPDLCRCCSRRG